MGLIGMLHYKEHPRYVKKAFPFAEVAKMEGIPFAYFSFNGVDFENKKISGWVYEEGEWRKKDIEIPMVIINSSNPKNQQQKDIMNKLKQFSVLTSHPVGNKLKVYKKILNSEMFAEYLIPSYRIHSPDDIFSFLKEQSKAVFKPISGNKGKQVFFIEQIGYKYKVTDGVAIEIFSKSAAWKFIDIKLNEQKFILQPFIDCKTKMGLVYDFRLHVQKNGLGEWEITLIYPRINGSGKMVSNISSGGYRGELDPFLLEEFGDAACKIKSDLEKFALTFPPHFDTLYEHSFDELGIDIGIDQNQKLWLFEVNWRPGCKNREFEVGRRLLPYCRYLANRKYQV